MDKYLGIVSEQARIKKLKAYLVGGAIRDDLLKQKINDYDFAVEGDCHNFAKDMAAITDGKYICMHRNAARVVCRDTTLDFCGLCEDTIQQDLLRRDFTINSLAMDVETGEIIDVNKGALDIEYGIIRHNSNDVFADDPVRMLRAVRLSAQLGFHICRGTRSLIKQNAELLNRVSAERILEELCKIFDSSESYKYVEMMNILGILDQVFPIVARMKKIGVCQYHVVNSYAHSLLTLRYFEKNIEKILDSPNGKRLKEHFESKADSRQRLNAIKLAAFLHDVGKPDAMHMEPGFIYSGNEKVRLEGEKVSFKGHDTAGEKVFDEISNKLKMSSKQKEIIRSVIKGHMRVLVLYKNAPNEKGIYKLFREFGENTIDVLICSLCDVNATRSLLEDNGESKRYWDFVMSLVDRYYNVYCSSQRLVTGDDVIAIKGIKGKNVGRILDKLDEQYFYGNVKNRREAVEFIENIELE